MQNVKAIHVVLVILGAIATTLPQLEASFPKAAAYFQAAISVCALLATVLGAISPSALGGASPAQLPPGGGA